MILKNFKVFESIFILHCHRAKEHEHWSVDQLPIIN